jgi:hypothetical protein
MVDLDAPLGEEFLDIAIGQAEAQVPADGDDDHIGREAESVKADRGTGAARGRQVLMPAVSPLNASQRMQQRQVGGDVEPGLGDGGSVAEACRSVVPWGLATE